MPQLTVQMFNLNTIGSYGSMGLYSMLRYTSLDIPINVENTTVNKGLQCLFILS